MSNLLESPLTDGQQRVLDYLRERTGGITPTIREIQQALGFKSQNSVTQLLRLLERKGLIRTLPGKARGVAVTVPAPERATMTPPDTRLSFIDVPLFGEVQAGWSAADPLQIPDTLPVHAPSMRLTERSRPFALRVRGDAMTGACIQEGDYVVFDSRCEPRPGDVVAAHLDNTTVLLRYVVRGGRKYLKAENPKYPDVPFVEERIMRGVMVGLIRGANLI